jgi:RecA-family ATPase
MEYDIIGSDMDKKLRLGDKLIVRTVALDDFALELVRATDTATQIEWADKLVDRFCMVVDVNSPQSVVLGESTAVSLGDPTKCDMTDVVKSLIRAVRDKQELLVLYMDVVSHADQGDKESYSQVDLQASLWPESGEACNCEGVRHAVLSNLR